MPAGSELNEGLGCCVRVSLVFRGLIEKELVEFATTGIEGPLFRFGGVVLREWTAFFVKKMKNEIMCRHRAKVRIVA